MAKAIREKTTKVGADKDATRMDKIKAMAVLVFKKVAALKKELEAEHWKEMEEQDDGYGDYIASQYDGYGNRVDSRSSNPDLWGKSELNEYYGYDEDYEGDWD
jgi:hypothetical protein